MRTHPRVLLSDTGYQELGLGYLELGLVVPVQPVVPAGGAVAPPHLVIVIRVGTLSTAIIVVLAEQTSQHAAQAALRRSGRGVTPIAVKDVEQVVEHPGEPFHEEPDTKRPRPHPTG